MVPKRQRLETFKPLKMDLTDGSETSVNINQTPGKHPEFYTVITEHGEKLKSTLTVIQNLPAMNPPVFSDPPTPPGTPLHRTETFLSPCSSINLIKSLCCILTKYVN
jgi:hypothetical protein